MTTLGAFMAALDSNIVTIALPHIATDLSANYSLLGWVLTGYVLAVAALVLQAGKLGDNYGKKRIYLTGFAVFGVASAVAGLSPDVYLLVAFRVIQGAGAAVMTATGLPLIFASFPPSERGTAVGVNSMAWAVGAVAGPVLGGLLTQVDWRLIFYVNVPVAAVAILLGRMKIPNWLDARNPNAPRLNLLSAVVFGVAIAFVMLWLTLLDPWLVVPGIVGIGIFVIVEAGSRKPMLSKELLKNDGFVYSVLSLSTMMTAVFGVLFVMSFYLQTVAGFSALDAGLWISPFPVLLGAANLTAGRLFEGLRRPAFLSILGAVVIVCALALLSSAISSPTPDLSVALLLAVMGLGGGLVWTPSISSALKFSKPEMRGVANGTTFTLINVGYATGVALAVSVSTAYLPHALTAQIYSGGLAGLTGAQLAFYDQGLVRAVLALSAVAMISIPFMVMVARAQQRLFESRRPGIAPA